MRMDHPDGDLIANKDQLTSHGDGHLRRLALDIAEAAILKANPSQATYELVRLTGDTLTVGQRPIDLSEGRRVFVIGAGKASFPIAQALNRILERHIVDGLVILKSPAPCPLPHIRTAVASHPVPDERSYSLACEMVRLLGQVRSGDVVLACFTGGSSSLFVQPANGISLEDKAEMNRVLLKSGANIIEINAVRKHMSEAKGGRLAQMLPKGVTLVNLTVSDVIGDRLDCITDPTVPDASTFADACATLENYELWPHVPRAVAEHLRRADSAFETCTEQDLAHINRIDLLLVRADAACAAAAVVAQQYGFTPMLMSTFFEGESSQLARNFGAIARQILWDGNPLPRPCMLIGGGETTVAIDGSYGTGGPNQEFAMRFAVELDGVDGVVALGIDTDGTDGPTPFAGALVDGTSAASMRDLGVDLLRSLRRHDVSQPLHQSGHIIETGATNTNVNDLKLVLIS